MFDSELKSLADDKYKQFTAKLVPNVDPNKILGVRMPALRALAKTLALHNEKEFSEFISKTEHRWHEEYILHSILLWYLKDYSEAVECLDNFLPMVDNWQVCDSIKLRVGKKDLQKYKTQIYKYLSSDKPYTIRFALVALLNNYLKDNFDPNDLQLVSQIKSDDYYVNMGIAWYYATALTHQYEQTVKLFEAKQLDKWINNKSIQKAIESARVSDDKKQYLRTLKL